MKKSLKWVPTLLASITLITFLASCGDDTKTKEKTPAESNVLKIEKAVLGKKNKANDKIDEVSSGKFKKGDTVALVLIHVGKFKKGEDGKHKFDMDMEITDGKGNSLAEKKELLGPNGNLPLDKDIAESPYGSIDTALNKLKPGEYTIKLTIYDKIGTGRATESKTFKLE